VKPISRNKNFENNFKKRIGPSPKLVSQFSNRLDLFIVGKRGAPLNDHALTGRLNGKRAFSVTGDIRVIYEETANEFIFLDVGTHNQVYR
jgi:mRNA-degrading endonuclease YafQ of YafQ-DinJ toxin-antitoxin module